MERRSKDNAEADRGKHDAQTILQNLQGLSPEQLRKIEADRAAKQ
jgi:hypothetical protein